jgi:hypothetical protein
MKEDIRFFTSRVLYGRQLEWLRNNVDVEIVNEGLEDFKMVKSVMITDGIVIPSIWHADHHENVRIYFWNEETKQKIKELYPKKKIDWKTNYDAVCIIRDDLIGQLDKCQHDFRCQKAENKDLKTTIKTLRGL